MAMLFNKLKNKDNSNGGTTTTADKDDGDHRGGYRTHLIFAGKRDPEGAGGHSSVSQSASHYFGGVSTTSFSSHSAHPFGQTQQPLRPTSQDARRKGSRPGLPDDELYRQSNKQVSFGAGGGNPVWTATASGLGGGGIVSSGIGIPGPHQPPSSVYGEDPGKPGMLEVVAGLSRDCFIIPLACVDRFLPAGLTLPEVKPKSNNNSSSSSSAAHSSAGTPLNVLEVADPQLAIVVHLMTPLISLSPPVESPQTQPERVQRSLAMQLLHKAAAERQASHGLLLASMETGSDFPMMALYTVQKMRIDVNDFVENCRKNALDMFEPSNIGYCGDHFFHMCREVATIARPPIDTPAKKGNSSGTGYIVSIFRVFEGDDREKLERNWLYWTGARTLYRHLPKSVGLRRITLHKSAALRGDKLYLLLCECANFLENVNSAAQLLPALRARLCGYTGIYRVAAAF
ncbi:unnamed protein product [Orchesella dallaii]|uniref:DUF7153 domain-containing protein n=1 Tax=Orchesella dallaii TaxID=48710 RepID=A0ABP1QTU3_9HEXA